MGQTLDVIMATVQGTEEEPSLPEPPMTDIHETALRQSMRVTGWGKMRHLDLVWLKNDGSLEDMRDVCILPDESIAVADRAHNHVRRFDRDGGDVTSMTGTKYRHLVPSGIACSRKGTLLVLCDNEYTRGLREFELMKPYNVRIAHEKLFCDATAIAVSPSSGLWVVLEAGDQNCVNVLREDATRMRHFGHKHLRRPAGVAVDAMDRIYVTDAKEHAVFVFTIDGDFLFRFGSHGHGDNELDAPHGICIDPQNNVYVADEMNDRVSVYSADGQLKFHLTTDLPLRRPRCMALDMFTGRLAVTSKHLQWISLYVFVLRETS